MTTGILLVNLGTPDAASVPAVWRYLAEFLADGRVVDLPAALRYFLLYGVILPRRSFSSKEAYQSIWTEQGSPLLIHSQNLTKKVSEHLGSEYCVALGMRYGNPSIASALKQLQHCERLVILPLFPQYASATNGSVTEKVFDEIKKQWTIPHITLINDFYQHPLFISAWQNIILKNIASFKPDHLLISYHGLPERHLSRSGCDPVCRDTACPAISNKNRFCYRAQAYATSAAIMKGINTNTPHSISFQSRLGRIPWIKPYTDHWLETLANQGVKRLLVACPSFVSDCLETLEEIGIRAKEDWLKLGGEDLALVPCLNDDETWVQAVCQMVA